MFKREPGKRPWAVLQRPGLTDETSVPFVITFPEQVATQDTADLEHLVVELLRAEPNTYPKTVLAKKCGKRCEDARTLIEKLQNEGRIVPKEAGAKLRLAASDAEKPSDSGASSFATAVSED
jgi:hypothetical protein